MQPEKILIKFGVKAQGAIMANITCRLRFSDLS